MNSLFDQIQAKYNELIELQNKAANLEVKFKALAEPFLPAAFANQDEYTLYLQQVAEWKAAMAEIENEYNSAKVGYSCTHSELLALLPYKCVWFNLPGTTTWIAKTSNNLTTPSGNHIHTETANSVHDLPKLTTC